MIKLSAPNKMSRRLWCWERYLHVVFIGDYLHVTNQELRKAANTNSKGSDFGVILY